MLDEFARLSLDHIRAVCNSLMYGCACGHTGVQACLELEDAAAQAGRSAPGQQGRHGWSPQQAGAVLMVPVHSRGPASSGARRAILALDGRPGRPVATVQAVEVALSLNNPYSQRTLMGTALWSTMWKDP